jgi:hypothetical protein
MLLDATKVEGIKIKLCYRSLTKCYLVLSNELGKRIFRTFAKL